MSKALDSDFSFYSQLWNFYIHEKKKIRTRYKDLTKKFLAYNDPDENPSAFLRRPQFEALSMYVFVKEFMDNVQVYKMFDDWRNRRDKFEKASYYGKGGQLGIFDAPIEEQNEELYENMKKYSESYPNYIYALTMGLGKTILMATCIFYEFLLAKKFPKDERFCHNALVFAPDKTVLQSLREIITFDKTKVVPPEYVGFLDANIKFHFLYEAGMTLHTIDGSMFNIIISNTQKIILKKKRKETTPVEILFGDSSLLSAVYGGKSDDDEAWDETSLMDNQRFKKLCRLPQLGVYVDEAHHLFGADLEKQIRSGGANKTSLRDTINFLSENTSIVGCYNYTGTPYVENQVLPEVVYSYGLKESIRNGFLKDADPIGFENVKSDEFLNAAVTKFWERYGGKTYEGLNPKLAIYASGIDEAVREVRPALEKIVADMGIPVSKILLNVGDERYTKDNDIRDFNNLDVAGSEGNEKQFIILVEKGKEGWNCRSLFGVALHRSPKSKIFVLQATMRCLRAITNDRLTASIFLSKENFDILDSELHKNFNMEIKDIKNPENVKRKKYQVRVMPPLRKIKLKRIWHDYSIREKNYSEPIDFALKDIDLSRYASTMYTGESLAHDAMNNITKTNVDYLQKNMKYSELSLVAEVARYLNISCILAAKIIREAKDGIKIILDAVNKYNQVLYDVIIPTVFNALFEVTSTQKSEEREFILLREPRNSEYYEFSGREDLVAMMDSFPEVQAKKSFHADTYCFDSVPEQRCFERYIASEKVKEVYFTGMFTSGQGDLSVYYYDQESGRLRQYYPDFLAKMTDDSYRLIEVKGDNMIDDTVVKAKADAVREMTVASGVDYLMYSSSEIMNGNMTI